MTVKKLKTVALKTARLTGEDADMLFRSAYDAAIFKLYNDLRLKKSLSLSVDRIRRLVYIPRIIHLGGETKTLPIAGRAYSLTVRGKGEMLVRDGAMTKSISFDTDSTVFKDFIKQGGEISFSGNYFFTVEDFSLYSEIFGGDISDIPSCGRLRVIDFSKYKDFGIFLGLAKDERGRAIAGSHYEDSLLYIPADYSGVLCVEYLRRASPMPDDSGADIDIPKAYEPLLLPLLLSYLLAEEDSDMAENYKKIYTDMCPSISADPSSGHDGVITNGWA